MRVFRFFLPRIEYVLFAGIFLGIAASGPRLLNFDGDLPRHILAGNLILDTHEVAATDHFSFRTVGYPSVPHEWLAQVIFALAHKWLGLSGIVLMTALILMLTWSIVYYRAMCLSRSLLISLLLVGLAVGASQIHVLPRPHIFTYVLTAAWVALLEQRNENDLRAWWVHPLMMLIWVNLHGMFVIGIMIWAIYLAGDFLDQPSITWFRSRESHTLMVSGLLSLAATFLSPSGPHIWVAISSLGSNTYITSRIPEYQSANFHMPETWLFVLMLLAVILGFARTTKKISWIQILLVLSFTGLALYSSRMIPLFAIVVAPIAVAALAGWVQDEYQDSRFLIIERNISKINSSSGGLIWLPILISIVIVLFYSGTAIDPEGRGNAFDESFFPVKATAWLKEHPQKGNMFNEFDWGGYLLLHLWPKQKIFIDGHTHIYGEELTREYEQVVTLDAGWEQLLVRYDITWVIARTGVPLARELSNSGNWAITYQDETAIILARR